MPNCVEVWNTIFGIIEDGRLKTVPLVMEELEYNKESAYKRLQPHRNKLVYTAMETIWLRVGELADTYDYMSRPRGIYTEADPWVVALAEELSSVVVTSELPKRNRHMPDVCRKEHINCISLAEFLTAEKLIP